VLQRSNDLTHVLGLQKGSQGSDLQIEILPPWESALKWGLGGVQPGSTPSGHSGEIAFTCAPAADSVLASGGQSRFRPGFNCSHKDTLSSDQRHLHLGFTKSNAKIGCKSFILLHTI